MELGGKVWKDGKFWLVEVPAIDICTQGRTKKEALMMIENAIMFGGVVFKDARWGSNYTPYDRSFGLDETVLFQIRDALKEQL